MINQYLLLDDKNKDKIEAYKPQGISIKVLPVKDTQLWIIEYSIKGISANNAKKLSDVHNRILKYSPITLTCESSEYYNKKLFPLINDFERKLRELLYLESSLLNNEDVKKTIGILEDKTLGETLELLFTDKEFTNNTKIRVNGQEKFNGYGKFSKSEILAYIENIEENTLWDKLIGVDYKFTIKNHFRDALKYRNNVMHAHNIETENYLEAKDLFRTINKELKNKISKIIKQAEDSSIVVKKDVNTLFSSALASIELSCADSWKNADFEYYKRMSSLNVPSEIIDSINNMNSLQFSPDYLETIKTIGEQANRYGNDFKNIGEMAKQYCILHKVFNQEDADDNDKKELESSEENKDIKKDKDDTNEK